VLELTRINPQGHEDATFGDHGSRIIEFKTNDYALGYLNAVDLAPDGCVIAAGQDGFESPSAKVNTVKGVIGRVLGSAGPAVQMIPRTLTKSTRYLTVKVLIRDTEKVDVSTLDNSDLKLFDPAGYTRRFRYLSSADMTGDGKYLAATYRIIGPNSNPWTSASNGIYQVRLQRKQIADGQGNYAMAYALGILPVNIV